MAAITLQKTLKQHTITFMLIGIMVLTVSKDLLHAFIKDSSFYLSESALFGTFWLLFVPLVMAQRRVLIKRRYIPPILVPVLLSFLHLTIFSLIVFAVSGLFFYHTFEIDWVFTDAFSNYSIACLLIYGGFSFLRVKNKPLPSNEKPAKIRVADGNKLVFLQSTDIVYIKTERPYIALVTKDRPFYTMAHSKGLRQLFSATGFYKYIKAL